MQRLGVIVPSIPEFRRAWHYSPLINNVKESNIMIKINNIVEINLLRWLQSNVTKDKTRIGMFGIIKDGSTCYGTNGRAMSFCSSKLLPSLPEKEGKQLFAVVKNTRKEIILIEEECDSIPTCAGVIPERWVRIDDIPQAKAHPASWICKLAYKHAFFDLSIMLNAMPETIPFTPWEIESNEMSEDEEANTTKPFAIKIKDHTGLLIGFMAMPMKIN